MDHSFKMSHPSTWRENSGAKSPSDKDVIRSRPPIVWWMSASASQRSRSQALSYTPAVGGVCELAFIYASSVPAVRPHGDIQQQEPAALLMASTTMMVSSATVARAASPAQSSMVSPFSGLKSLAGVPFPRKANADLSHLPSNGCRVQCMKVWPIEGVKKFETLSYLPDLPPEDLLKQIDYLIRSKWIPCLEFCKRGFVWRQYHASPGYYDGRYWTMWRLPMFGCTDATQVAQELENCKKEYPDAFIRIIGFDNVRQVQCISFIAYKPPKYSLE